MDAAGKTRVGKWENWVEIRSQLGRAAAGTDVNCKAKEGAVHVDRAAGHASMIDCWFVVGNFREWEGSTGQVFVLPLS